MATKGRKIPRRVPQQARSAEVVAAIVEATDRVVLRLGIGGLTTTLVAATAGVSVGTLYQYFPSKAALLAAWEERTMGALFEDLKAHAIEVAGLDVELRLFAITRRAVDGVVRVALRYRFDGDAQFAARTDEKLRLAEACSEFIAGALEANREAMRPLDLKLAATLVVKTAVTMAFTAAAEHQVAVESGAFQHELSTMIARYLLVDKRLAALEP